MFVTQPCIVSKGGFCYPCRGELVIPEFPENLGSPSYTPCMHCPLRIAQHLRSLDWVPSKSGKPQFLCDPIQEFTPG